MPADGFDEIINGLNQPTPPAFDPYPYGPPTTANPTPKPGLTTRGKAAIGIGAAVIAGGGLLGYQAYASNAAANDLKAKELQLKAEALELEKLKVTNQVRAAGKQTATEQAAARQKHVDTCVQDLKDQIGKGYGSPSYGEIVEDCQSQYPATTAPAMEAAASSTDTDTDGGGGVNDGILIGVLALGAVAVIGAKKGTRNTPTA
ncbi:hypothetical protein [Streptomyces sp. NPDC059783]|uniref:hypothetical protein n=1 Tax=Streptomyces sp. NPDC059783 TaxID=3346944 RepID=UPI00365B2C4F